MARGPDAQLEPITRTRKGPVRVSKRAAERLRRPGNEVAGRAYRGWGERRRQRPHEDGCPRPRMEWRAPVPIARAMRTPIGSRRDARPWHRVAAIRPQPARFELHLAAPSRSNLAATNAVEIDATRTRAGRQLPSRGERNSRPYRTTTDRVDPGIARRGASNGRGAEKPVCTSDCKVARRPTEPRSLHGAIAGRWSDSRWVASSSSRRRAWNVAMAGPPFGPKRWLQTGISRVPCAGTSRSPAITAIT